MHGNIEIKQISAAETVFTARIKHELCKLEWRIILQSQPCRSDHTEWYKLHYPGCRAIDSACVGEWPSWSARVIWPTAISENNASRGAET